MISRDLVNLVLMKIPLSTEPLVYTCTSAILRFQLTFNIEFPNSLGKIIFFPPSPKYTQLKELNIFCTSTVIKWKIFEQQFWFVNCLKRMENICSR